MHFEHISNNIFNLEEYKEMTNDKVDIIILGNLLKTKAVNCPDLSLFSDEYVGLWNW